MESSNDRVRRGIDRVRRSRRVIPYLLGALWLIQLSALWWKATALLAVTGPMGIETFPELAAAALQFDSGKEQFSRFEVFLMREGLSMVTSLFGAVLVTVFTISLLPLLRFTESLAATGSDAKSSP